jgi:hypothetical protein
MSMARTKATGTTVEKRSVVISPPNFQYVRARLRGVTILVINAFSEKAKQEIRRKQEKGSQAKKGTKKEPKNFQQQYEGSKHVSTEGWCGFPCAGIRAAMISACRVAGFQMTRSKISVFCEPDGIDREDGTPLVKITKGNPYQFEQAVRISGSTTDLHARAAWKPGWEMEPIIRFDGDQFSTEDVANLIMRAGAQIGIGEGRFDSKNSCGQGWGQFDLVEKRHVSKK